MGTPLPQAMPSPFIECVPNVSEGRNEAVIRRLVAAVDGTTGVTLLGAEPDADYHRTVITFVGGPEAVVEAAFNLYVEAVASIDMREHSGEHPRLGAVDVCPFIPLRDATLTQCAELAQRLSLRVGEELDVPTYLYGETASAPSRQLLSHLRKGEYEGLYARLTDAEATPDHEGGTRWPDVGPREWTERVARTGGTVIGARPVLVAYNVNLVEPDAVVARKVGSLVRGSGRLVRQEDGRRMRVPGMLGQVQGMGVTLEEHGISQVSMNLQNVEDVPMHLAFEAVRSLAADHGVEVTGGELVGLAPLSAFLAAGEWYHADPEGADEQALVAAAIEGLGLDDLGEFDPTQRIIEWAAGL